MTRIYEIASDYVDRFAALDPVAATGMGVPGHDAEITDYSPEGFETGNELSRETLQALAEAPIEDERDRVARDAMMESLVLRMERHDAGEHFRNLSIIGNPSTSIRRAFDLMPRATEEDWAIIAKRLGAVPAGIGSFERLLRKGVDERKPGARRQALENAAQAEVWSGRADGATGYFRGIADELAARPAGSAALREEVRAAASGAAAAFAAFAAFLRDWYVPRSIERDAVGPDRYQLGSRAFNGISLDLHETYSWGWDELHRVEAEMAATCARILPGAKIEETKAFLESEPGRAVEGVEPFREWMQALQDRTIAELNAVHFDIPEPIRKVEAMIAPPGGALAMYYTGPSEDLTRPGRTWYPTGGKTRFPLWGEVSIAYHEGVPGHHLQIGTTKYLAGRLSRFQRLMGGVSGYIEGWALYAERLMAELGYLENPDYYLGLLRAQAMRCVRVVVDIGMHLELPIPADERFHPGERWTPELGDAFARERSQFPVDFMASEITRYLGTPGQAISYKVGERVWLEAREDSRGRQPAGFDLKAWHRHALELGPMGLGQMTRELAGA